MRFSIMRNLHMWWWCLTTALFFLSCCSDSPRLKLSALCLLTYHLSVFVNQFAFGLTSLILLVLMQPVWHLLWKDALLRWVWRWTQIKRNPNVNLFQIKMLCCCRLTDDATSAGPHIMSHSVSENSSTVWEILEYVYLNYMNNREIANIII